MRSLEWVAGEATPCKVYITRVFNYGTWQEWQQMNGRYSQDDIRDAVMNPLRGVWTPRGKVLAELIYDCRLPADTLLSFDV